jgi:hypothetical protein
MRNLGSAGPGNMSPFTAPSTKLNRARSSQERRRKPLKGVGKSFAGCDSLQRAGWNSLRSAKIAKLLALWDIGGGDVQS